MARIHTSGAEIALAVAGNATPDISALSGTVTRDTGVFRSGVASMKCDSTGGNATARFSLPKHTNNLISDPLAASGTFFVRVYMQFGALPASTVRVLDLGNISTNSFYAALTSAGKLQLFNGIAGTQIGSDSAATIAAGSTWYRIEIKVVTNASTQVTDVELQLDGVSVASATGLTAAIGTSVNVGWVEAPGASKVCYVDDCAVNDATGAANNTWPGDGNVVLLKPISDNAGGTGWVLGTGTALGGNGFAAVDNTPPLGVADLAAGSDPKQIRNATSAANSNMDVNLTSYTTAGVGASDTVNAVTPFCVTAAPVTTSSKQGTFGVSSNPVITNIALSTTGTSGAFWAGATAGTWPTGWKWTAGTTTNAPSVTLGTSPVARITQVTSSTRIAMCCFIGMYVDYTPAVAAAVIPDVAMALRVT